MDDVRKAWRGAALVAPGLLIVALAPQPGRGEEPGLFGRLFRFGGGGGSSPSTPASPAPEHQPSASPESVIPPLSTSTPTAPTNAPTPRLIPQPRVSRALTESDPIVTQFSLIHSNEGRPFGTFLQVFADGTVLNSEGVHHVAPADLKPVVDSLQMGDLYRLKGLCGGPATDYIQQVHVIVYERYLGRLRANAFSYSGNPEGCSQAVRHLHAALEGLQAKLSRPMPDPTGSAPSLPSPPNPAPAIPAPTRPESTPATGGPSVIPLTPIE